VISQVAGVNTNISFLERLSAHNSFQDGDVHTGFIEVGVVNSRAKYRVLLVARNERLAVGML